MSDYPVVTIPGIENVRRKEKRPSLHPRSIMLDDDRYHAMLEIADSYSEGVRMCIDHYLEHIKPR